MNAPPQITCFNSVSPTATNWLCPRYLPGGKIALLDGDEDPTTSFRDGLLFGVSAAYSTLLVIDLESKAVTQAYAVPGLEDPVGLAASGAELLIALADGRVAVIERPAR